MIGKTKKLVKKKGRLVDMSKNKKVGAYKQVGKMYSKALGFIRTKQIVTRSMVEKFYTDAGKSEAAASASATVLLSPRKEDSKRGKLGNCLGNYSADGTHYYMIPLKHVKGEEKKFRFHLATPAEVTVREAIEAKRGNGRKATKVAKVKKVKEVKQVKISKIKAKVKKAKAKKVVAPVAPVAPTAEVAPVAPAAEVAPVAPAVQ
jgi:hypothetical protein